MALGTAVQVFPGGAQADQLRWCCPEAQFARTFVWHDLVISAILDVSEIYYMDMS